MKNKKKNLIITILIIIAIIVIAIFAFKNNTPKTDAETAKCIGSKSTLYTQLGCSHCKTQEEMFGENYQYLNKIDCWYDNQLCINNNITGTPTWIIKNEKIVGVQSIDKLKELTGC